MQSALGPELDTLLTESQRSRIVLLQCVAGGVLRTSTRPTLNLLILLLLLLLRASV